MPVRKIYANNPLSDAIPRGDDDHVEVSSTGSIAETARLYSDVSEDEFADCEDDFLDDLNKLERDYFESLHVDDVELNATFSESRVYFGGKAMSKLEEEHFHQYNVTPDRPCSAFFKTDAFMPAADIFAALKEEGFLPEHIRCLQRKPSGEVFITFRTNVLRDAFLSRSSFVCRQQSFAVNDDERPLTFLTIYDSPDELPDTAIIHRLRPYCEVIWYRRGSFRNQSVHNGLRHYRVRLHHALPSYLRFGRFLIRLYHDGQSPTCRRCNRQGHKAASCQNTVCFNCDGLGHVARDCVRPMFCCICKSGQHLARICPFSWHREPPPQQVEEDAVEEFPANLPDVDASMDGDPPPDGDISVADVRVDDHVNTNDVNDSEVNGADAVEESFRHGVSPDGPPGLAAELSIPDSQLLDVQTPPDPPETPMPSGSSSQETFDPSVPSASPRVIDSSGELVPPCAPATANASGGTSSLDSVSTPGEKASMSTSDKSWAEVVDESFVPPVPKPKRTGIPQRRKGAVVKVVNIPPRKPTQPTVVSSRRAARHAPPDEDPMDLSESRKRKDPPPDS